MLMNQKSKKCEDCAYSYEEITTKQKGFPWNRYTKTELTLLCARFGSVGQYCTTARYGRPIVIGPYQELLHDKSYAACGLEGKYFEPREKSK